VKGIVFTEFLQLVETQWGIDMVDDLIDATQIPSGGAYSSVASYDFSELASLLEELSRQTNVPRSELLVRFGNHLAAAFANKFPDFFTSKETLFDFIESVDSHIHVEVKKLYPDADLPNFDCERKSNQVLAVTYSSLRPLADLAEGLITGCADYFHQPITLQRENKSTAHGYCERIEIRTSP